MNTVTLIAGLAHSGSTILERALATNGRAVGVGEVLQSLEGHAARGYEAFRTPCSCGSRAIECPVWSVLSTMDDARDDAERIQRVIARATGLTGIGHVVDSSKRLRQAVRYRQLRESGHISLHCVLLVRDYRAWCLTEGMTRGGRNGTASYLRRAWRWAAWYGSAGVRLRRLGLPFQVVIYDRFAVDPGPIVAAVHAAATPDIHHPLDFDLGTTLQHAVCGNRVRRTPEINATIRYDDSWTADRRSRRLLPLLAGPELVRRHLWRRDRAVAATRGEERADSAAPR
jgi:hypothetical protein